MAGFRLRWVSSETTSRWKLSREAERLNERGRELSNRGDAEGAISAYRSAAAADDSWSVFWYNLGLQYKYRGQWHDSVECNGEAVKRDESDGDAWWNLGIAATAIGDWPLAREAWRRCGITVPEGEGPIEANYGLVPIRLAPGTRGEVVWCDRIDPARAIIRNLPLPESGHLYGDLMLHDGAPNGTRTRRGGEEVPVFDALECLETSEFRTYILDVPGSSEAQRALLSEVAFDLGGAAEDWSQSVSFLCRRCSEGRPHERHDSELKADRPALAVAAAAKSEAAVRELIEAWRGRSGFSGYVGVSPAGDA
jgi:hypothetical protein